jgi:hypothetical protein
MMKHTALIVCAIAAFTAMVSATSPVYPLRSPKAFTLGDRIPAKPGVLAKFATSAWKKIASTHYVNANDSVRAPLWGIFSRDTVVYDRAGNLIITKTSRAQSGWSHDSLLTIDSSVYKNGILVESIRIYSFISFLNSRKHTTFTEMHGGKVRLITDYGWNSTTHDWNPEAKDSSLLVAPYSDELSDIKQSYFWSFDTAAGGSWKLSYSVNRIDAECTPTTTVLAMKDANADTSAEIKISMTFASPAKTNNTLTREAWSMKDPVTGNYYDVTEEVRTCNEAGFEISRQKSFYDSSTRQMKIASRTTSFPDAHGNDTLQFSYDLNSDTSTDTLTLSAGKRFQRQYDTYGNNIVTITANLDRNTGTWTPSRKDTVVFSQLTASIQNAPRNAYAAAHGLSMQNTASSIRFVAPSITSLQLFDLSGRLIVSISQKPGSSIELKGAACRSALRSGTYIARLMCKGKEMVMAVPVVR